MSVVGKVSESLVANLSVYLQAAKSGNWSLGIFFAMKSISERVRLELFASLVKREVTDFLPFLER